MRAALLCLCLLAGACASGKRSRQVGPVPPESWPDQHPERSRLLAFGAGRFRHKTTQGPTMDDQTSAVFGRYRHENGKETGLGLSIVSWGSDEDLHGIAQEAFAFDAFIHFTYHLRPTPRFRMPIRIGGFLDYQLIEGGRGLVGDPDVHAFALGPRFEVEPEFDLVQRPDFRLSVFGSGAIGYGFSRVDDDAAIFPGDEADVLIYSLESGVYCAFQRFTCGLSYVYWFVDRENSTEDPRPGAEYTFHGLLLTVGMRW